MNEYEYKNDYRDGLIDAQAGCIDAERYRGSPEYAEGVDQFQKTSEGVKS